MLELLQIQIDLIRNFAERGWNIERILTGTLMSSLEMHGFSITILNLSNLDDKNKILNWLDQKTDCKAWEGVLYAKQPRIPKFETEIIQKQL